MRIDLVLVDSEGNQIVTLENVPLLANELDKPFHLGLTNGLPEDGVYHVRTIKEYDFRTELIMKIIIEVVKIA